VEVGNLSLVRRFVASGLGLAPVPAVAFPAGGRLPGVRTEALQGVSPVRYLRVVRAGAPLPPPAAALLSLLAPA
jgi:DNA-binding transcriptional LysR family regulator